MTPGTFAWQEQSQVVWPSVGGGNISLVARIGDWTWQAVAEAYSLDVLTAQTEAGAPAYLSFHYCRYRAGDEFHLRTPTFGDRLDVASLVTSAGPQSTLTLHRIARTGPRGPLAPPDFAAEPPPGELRVEHLNRWITPLSDGNTELASTTPVGFHAESVPETPPELSPRPRVRLARDRRSFRCADLTPVSSPCHLAYEVDAARDLNAVGLMYFAAYSGLVDWALWQACRRWGVPDPCFIRRVALDQEMLYLGNADAGSTLDLVVTRWRGVVADVVDVVISRREDGMPICVSTITLRPMETSQ